MPVNIYVSDNNPGAHSLASVLAAGMNNSITITTDPCSLPLERRNAFVAKSLSEAVLTDMLRGMTGLAPDDSRATHFVLYLNMQTFVGAAGQQLAGA